MTDMFTLGSLFDGSGGFPLGASLCGGTPLWASEIEPYPIAVTTSRFPEMTHLGDVRCVDGAKVTPVDVITFGSPCQDLSTAGRRKGILHAGQGDAETTRSGLFLEAIRIIDEMRRASNGKYPRFCIWENVPGAFSSNEGEDFRTVLQSFIRIPEPKAVMPEVPRGGGGHELTITGETDGALLTEFLTLNTGVRPSEGPDCSLSSILEDNVPERYFLSVRACEGILRRSERRGKPLPPVLKEALTQRIALA